MRDSHQEFFDALAAEWDLHYTAEDFERLSHLVDKLGIDSGSSVINLGCATGVLFDLLRRKVGPNGLLTGVDFSYCMAQQAHRNFPFPNVTVIDADASNLPFLNSTYDLAISFDSFAHFSRKQRTLNEISRVLKLGATLYLIDLASSQEVTESHQRKGGALENDKIPPEEELRQMFAETPFDQVKIEDHPGLFLVSAVNAK